MSAIYILWLRELKRYTRSRAQMVASLGQPLLYLLALGFGLGPVFKKAGGGNYLQFLAPGVIGMSVLFSSIFSGLGLLWDRQFGFLKETLVAPVSRMQIMAGKTAGGATVAVIQGTLVMAICLIAGFRPAHLALIPLAFVFMVMIALFVCGAGDGDRIGAAGHAGIPVDHEFPGDADFLSFRRAVSAGWAGRGDEVRDQGRSAGIRDRRDAKRIWIAAGGVRSANRFCGAVGAGMPVDGFRGVPVQQDRGLRMFEW